MSQHFSDFSPGVKIIWEHYDAIKKAIELSKGDIFRKDMNKLIDSFEKRLACALPGWEIDKFETDLKITPGDEWTLKEKYLKPKDNKIYICITFYQLFDPFGNDNSANLEIGLCIPKNWKKGDSFYDLFQKNNKKMFTFWDKPEKGKPDDGWCFWKSIQSSKKLLNKKDTEDLINETVEVVQKIVDIKDNIDDTRKKLRHRIN